MNKSKNIACLIKKEIETGKWKEGEKLPSEAELCKIYSASRTSIRDAINTLAVKGDIVTYRGKGSFVNKKDNSTINTEFWLKGQNIGRIDLFEFRRVFEVESVSLAAQRADESIIEQLKKSVVCMQYAKTAESAIEQDMIFHFLISEATQNIIMQEIFNMMRPAYHKMFSENVALRGVDGYKEHLLILSAIESRNPDQARTYMADHLNKSMMQNTVDAYMNIVETKSQGTMTLFNKGKD